MASRYLTHVVVALLISLTAAVHLAAADEKRGPGIVEYDCGDRACTCKGGPTSDDCQNMKKDGWCKSNPEGDIWTMVLLCCPKTQTCCCSIGSQDPSACSCGGTQAPQIYRFQGTPSPGPIRSREGAEGTPPVPRAAGQLACPAPPKEPSPAAKPGYVWVAARYEDREGRCGLVHGHWERARRTNPPSGASSGVE